VARRILFIVLALTLALPLGCGGGGANEPKVKVGSDIDTSLKPKSMRGPAVGGKPGPKTDDR